MRRKGLGFLFIFLFLMSCFSPGQKAWAIEYRIVVSLTYDRIQARDVAYQVNCRLYSERNLGGEQVGEYSHRFDDLPYRPDGYPAVSRIKIVEASAVPQSFQCLTEVIGVNGPAPAEADGREQGTNVRIWDPSRSTYDLRGNFTKNENDVITGFQPIPGGG